MRFYDNLGDPEGHMVEPVHGRRRRKGEEELKRTLSISLSQTDIRRLKRAAALAGVSVSVYVRKCINHSIDISSLS